jgi:hypothetical protein
VPRRPGSGGPNSDGLDAEAFAELLAEFHTGPYTHGRLIDDPGALAEKFPGTKVLRLHPVRARRDSGSVTLEFQSYQVDDGRHGWLVVREWTVAATADQPATWANHEIAQVPMR